MWHMHDMGWGWWLLMVVGMVGFWGLVLYGVFRLARGDGPRRSEPATPESPDELLRRRLAAGEITVEEYERLRVALERGPPGPREPAPL